MTALGSVLSSKPALPPYARRVASSLLSRQLLRPAGFRGLCAAIYGEGDVEEDTQVDKLENIAKIVGVTPSGMDSKVKALPSYYADF